MDNFHHKLNNLFVVERVSQKNGNQQYWGNSPSPMGPMLKSDFPQVKNVTRVNYTGVIIKQGDNVFRESVTFVDDAFYKMFDFPLKWGNKTTALPIRMALCLLKPAFGKAFRQTKPYWIKIVSVLRFNNNGGETVANFTVKGVFDTMPIESSWSFSALVPRGKMAALGMDKPGDWGQSADITFVEADNEAALSPVMGQSKNTHLQLYNASQCR